MMTVSQASSTTSSGTQLYRDDPNRQRYYVMPIGLDIAVDEDGEYRFSLLFYQTDFPERGARLVLTLSPTYPQLDPTDVTAANSNSWQGRCSLWQMPFLYRQQ